MRWLHLRGLRSAILQPLGKGRGALSRFLSKHQPLDTNIFVEIGPMQSITRSADLKLGALGGRALCQPGIPADWNRDRTTVFEINGQRVVRHYSLEDPS